MRRSKILWLGCLTLVIFGAIYRAVLIRRGFSVNAEPSAVEKVLAGVVRNLSPATMCTVPAITRNPRS